ncbi:hypothetical protein ACUXQ2_006231 [Cupriavidus metallidurans]|uniref:hypothetical protein n=1 Tax=Cupriavidus sp. HMR-1 TaxID=1249621 RepID=UPI0002A23382|nr:hypothetical protein [Cupriavidus sp. HMR-1]EKZ99034.1 hypothetical protein D769_12331 [Cupriavidus sp. HMR-1]
MYNALVEAFRAAQVASADAIARVSALAAQAGAEALVVPLHVDHPGEFRRFLRCLVASLIDRASNEFGIAGAPVSIDETRIPVNGYPNIWEAIRAGETPDLDRYWRVLAERYEHCGRALACRQVAKTLAASLQLDSPNAVRRFTKVMRLRLKAPSLTTVVRPMRRIAVEAHAEVRAALLALAAFAQDAGEPALAGCLRQFDHGEAFGPQQRRTFPGLDVLQYNEYWELRFSAALGERLLAFVDQHLSEPVAA